MPTPSTLVPSLTPNSKILILFFKNYLVFNILCCTKNIRYFLICSSLCPFTALSLVQCDSKLHLRTDASDCDLSALKISLKVFGVTILSNCYGSSYLNNKFCNPISFPFQYVALDIFQVLHCICGLKLPYWTIGQSNFLDSNPSS